MINSKYNDLGISSQNWHGKDKAQYFGEPFIQSTS